MSEQNDPNDTPVECPRPWSSNPDMDPRSETVEEPSPRARLSSVPSERPPLPDNPTDRDYAKAWMSMSAAYHHELVALKDILASIDLKLSLRQAVLSAPPGYRALVVAVVLLGVAQVFEIGLLLRLLEHFPHLR